MATTAITAESLEFGAESADLPDAGGGAGNGIVAGTPADGWVISAEAGRHLDDGRLILKFVADATGDTVVIKAGDRPPSQLADKGDDSVVLAASDARYYAPEIGRHLQSDGTMLVTCTDAGTTLTAIHLPKGY